MDFLYTHIQVHTYYTLINCDRLSDKNHISSDEKMRKSCNTYYVYYNN